MSETHDDDDAPGEDFDPIPTAANYLDDYAEVLDHRRAKGRETGYLGIATGLPSLDRATNGIQRVTVLAGPTQSGKTSLASQICLNALKNDPKLVVLYQLYDPDMCMYDLFDQLFCQEAKLDIRKYLAPDRSRADHAKLTKAEDVFERHNIWTRFLPVSDRHRFVHGCTGELMLQWCQRLMHQAECSRAMTVVDMFDDLPLPTFASDAEEQYRRYVDQAHQEPSRWRREQILSFAKASRAIQPEGFPIVALCKLRKHSARDARPEIDDLLGSVELAYQATGVVFLVPERTTNRSPDDLLITADIKKYRRGDASSIRLHFWHREFRFSESTDERGSSTSRSNSKNKSPQPDPLAGLPD